MQYIARLSLIWMLRVALVLVLMFSLPTVGIGELNNIEQEQNTSEVEHFERKFLNPARVKSQITAYVGVVQITEQWKTSPPVAPILPALCLYFFPIIYKFLLRQRLNPLKFTTHFVAVL